jgi:predicted nuclease of predicted toxin-antitoxin system
VAKLRFYLNESVNIAVANGLRRRGIEAISSKDAGNLGLSDEEQLNYAIRKGFVIVTHDTDFLAMTMNFEHKGIVYVHQQKYGVGDLVRRLKLLWEIADSENLLNHVEFL